MIRRTQKEAPEDREMTTANLTSMTDVLLTLLIMFMVAETASKIFGFNMKLPQVVQQVSKPDNTALMITYTKKRDLFVTTSKEGDTKLQREKLKAHLAQLKAKYRFDQVIIQADIDLEYKEIISLMDDARRAGLKNISLATGL